jgi:serine/threonine protein kinase
VQGPTLHEAAKPLPDPVLRLLATGLAEALAALHAQGIVHRDVKPANVILTHQGPVLVDLGIARTQDLTALTRAGLVIGSPGWMAPEQMTGGHVTAGVDVWGWGAALLYGATGRLPFGDVPIEVLMHRLRTEEPDLSGVPAWLEPPLRRALTKQPAARATAAEILGTLGGQAPTVALRGALAPTVAAPLPSPAMPPAPGAPQPVPARTGSRGWLAPVAVMAAVIAAAAAWVFFHRPPADTASQQAGSSARRTPAATSTAQRSPVPPTSSTTPPTSSSTSRDATTPPTATDTSGQGPAWEDRDVVLRAVRSEDQERPAFPDAVPGYSLADQNRETVRVFTGTKQWQTPEDFPATGSECDQQRFYVRWVSLDPSADVEATWVSYDGSEVESKSVRGSAGWQSNDGCSRPAFRLRSSGSRSTLTDLVVEVQRWAASS